jgi:hypothetical protein
MFVEAVKARLSDAVPALRTVEGAANLAALMASNGLPQQTPAAHVVTLGIQGGDEEAAAGAFVQSVTEVVGVIVTWRMVVQTDRAVADVETLIDEITQAVAGWEPEGAMAPFRLLRGQLVTMNKGTLVYQLDFAIPNQLRIFG